MSDERIVEVMARGIADDRGEFPGFSGTFHDARAALAALRADGWELYRPEECVRLEVKGPIRIPSQAPTQFYDQQGRRFSLLGDSSLGTYRLVPVESEDRQ